LFFFVSDKYGHCVAYKIITTEQLNMYFIFYGSKDNKINKTL